MIRGASPLDGAWFGGGPTLSPDAQIAVYREQFWLRLGEAVTEDIPGLSWLLGQACDEVVRAYLLDCPPETWTLTAVSAGLADWLAARGAPPEQVDMARLDRAVAAGFLAAEGRPFAVETLTAETRLRLAPPVALLRLRTSLHRIRAAVLCHEPVPALEEGDFPLVIYRTELQMRHWETAAHAWTLLANFEKGATVAEAIAASLAQGVPEPVLTEQVGAWFEAFGTRGLLEPAPEGDVPDP